MWNRLCEDISSVDLAGEVYRTTSDVREILHGYSNRYDFRKSLLSHLRERLQPGAPTADDYLFNCRRSGFKVAAFFWAPGVYNAPHRHNTWSIASVLFNSVVIKTYDTAHFEDCNEFMLTRQFEAKAGVTGRVMPPCIHRIGNVSSMGSISLHVIRISEDDRVDVPDTVWFKSEGERYVAFDPKDIDIPETRRQQLASAKFALASTALYALG